MSERKGLKQSRLPFQIISTSPKISGEHKASPISTEKSCPKTPITSRKRKPSNDGDNLRLSKIGRTNSKENIIAEQNPIEIIDSSDEASPVNTINDDSIVNNSATETTPTATPQENKIRIKIQSCSKRKQVVKPPIINPDDSIVYIDDEEIQNAMNKKSTKKSEKKKGSSHKVSKEKSKKIKKSLNLNPNEDQTGTMNSKINETKENELESMEIDEEEHVFDDDDNEKSDIDSTEPSKIASIRDRLEECMNKKLKECKEVSIILKKISMPHNTDDAYKVDDFYSESANNPEIEENKNIVDDKADKTSISKDKLDESKAELDESNAELDESKIDLNESIESSEKDEISEKSTSESEESPKIDNNKGLSEEISKLVDVSPQNEDSANKDLHDEFVEIFTDDEKMSPTNPNTPNITRTTPKLTPKALARRREQESRRIEKEMQRQKEKEEREKQRLKEKEMREEVKRKEREEKEELRKREKEEREKKRLAEMEKKEEEKRQKEEERKRLAEQKEEEKRQKEEERRQKEEERKRQNEAREEEKKKKEMERIKEEERKKKAAQAFTKFFVPKKKSDLQIDDDASKDVECSDVAVGNFMPFQIHGKMRLAPRTRTEISNEQKKFLDEILKSDGSCNDPSKLYVQQLKSADYNAKSSTKTWPEDDKDDDVVVIDELEGVGEDIKEDEAYIKMKHRAKLLLFKENKRPAFYGTWRKKSKSISARRPFAQDPEFFDYEVDSDDEFEEEEPPGESLHGSDSDKEKDWDDDEYENDDFLVPHGHLSEDEMQHDDEMMEDNSPETQKAKLKVLQQEFAAQMKKKTEKIKPRLIGCIWMNGDEDEDGGSKNANLETKYHCSDIIWRILKAREMFSSGDEIKMEDFEPEILESEEDNQNEEKSGVKQPKTPAQIKVRLKLEGESEIKELIRLIHYNTNNKKFLIKEYQAYRLKNFHKLPDFQEFQVKSVDEKINEISVYKTCPEEGPLFGKKCWCVKEEAIKQYFGDEKLPMPNQWTYILEKEKKLKPGAKKDENRSRELTPTDEKISGTDNLLSTEPKTIPESPKPANSLKITNFVKSSPKNSHLPTTPKAAQSPKPSTSKTLIQSTEIGNGSSKVQPTTVANNGNSEKKRVAILMSVQRGQSINQEKKNLIVNEYLQTNQKKDVQPLNENEIIEVD